MKIWMRLAALVFHFSVGTSAMAITEAETYDAFERKDYATAFTGFSALAMQGDNNAQGVLAIMYSEGLGAKLDIKKSIFWEVQAAEQGNWISQYGLSEKYSSGTGVEINSNKTLFWMGLVCKNENGHEKYLALCKMVEPLLSDSIRVEISNWSIKTAEQAREIAHEVLQGFDKKILTEKKLNLDGGDNSEEFRRLKAKAMNGDAVSQVVLGLDYVNGKYGAVNNQLAALWFMKSAEQGNSMGQLFLGQQYDRGTGMQLDQKKAFYWYLKAAEQGIEMAQYEIGLRYTNGYGIPKDDLLAFGWFLKAAEQGNSKSQAYVGISYAAGRVVSKDYRLSLLWIQKAADQNNAIGQYSLGMMYSNGQGISKDEDQAIRWFKKAASQGNVEAQFRLGAMYGLGRGTTKDIQQAYFWWLLAAAQGHQEAARGRDIYELNLTSKERSEAQAAARVWKPAENQSFNTTTGMESGIANGMKPRVASADSTGSGFRVAPESFVTNHHVVEGCSRLSVNGVPAQMRGSDARNDLALLNANLAGPSTTLRSRRASVGEQVAVAGYPLHGLLSGFNLTTGTLSVSVRPSHLASIPEI
jgi:TPR repeat protein